MSRASRPSHLEPSGDRWRLLVFSLQMHQDAVKEGKLLSELFPAQRQALSASEKLVSAQEASVHRALPRELHREWMAPNAL